MLFNESKRPSVTVELPRTNLSIGTVQTLGGVTLWFDFYQSDASGDLLLAQRFHKVVNLIMHCLL